VITHPRLAHALRVLRPGVPFSIRDDGNGPFLVEMQDPPTQEEVDAVPAEQLDIAQATKNGVPDISDRQFAQQLKVSGLITQAEALAFVGTGTLPAALQAIVDGIQDQTAKEAAQILIAGATVFKRNHPLVAAIGQAYGMTSDQLDTLWVAASKL
jgi:hypothetical protein